ncbi:hypothetical protein BDZ91DRAFT_678812 [Kalaharituber pfeilii]|nr:hypothetical protein BDZ91DRAFT_678812 [Kalaharituber pfeilii]
MAVAPKFASNILGSPNPPVHTIELYLDYVCPFSAKLFKQYYNNVVPIINRKYNGKVQTIFRHQVQPWHPSSTLVHETALAVGRLVPEKFWEFSAALFEKQTEYFDVNVVNETRNQTYDRLSALAASITGITREAFYEQLAIPSSAPPESQNTGNQITNDLKLHIKAARQNSIHISPTVLFNGNVENLISSGWTVKEWEEWLSSHIV